MSLRVGYLAPTTVSLEVEQDADGVDLNMVTDEAPYMVVPEFRSRMRGASKCLEF